MAYKWQKISLNHQVQHINPDEDKCYFFMPYTPKKYISGPGYKASEANSRIYNFKENMQDTKSRGHLRYIQLRRQEFAEDLKPAIESLISRNSNRTVSLVFVPTSKRTDDPRYNDAFEIVCKHLKEMFGAKIIIETPVETIESRESSSFTGPIRNRQHIEDIKSNLKWLGFQNNPDNLIIFDDVITTGAHFTALKELVAVNSTKSPEIVGLFWALSQKPPDR